MLDELPTWTDTGNGEGVRSKGEKRREPEPVTTLLPQGTEEGFFSAFKRRLRVAANIALNVLLWAVIGAGCWFAHGIFTAPDFSEVKAEFEAGGYPEEGERMAELGKVCRNGAATPMACKALYFGNIPPKKPGEKERPLE